MPHQPPYFPERFSGAATGFIAACVLWCVATLPAYAVDATWALTGGGEWRDNANWDTNFPNGASDTATLSGFTGDSTVTVNSGVSVNQLTINSDNNIDLAASNIDFVSAGAKVTLAGAGNHTFTSDTSFANDLTIEHNGTGTFTFSDIGANSLTVTGTGNVEKTSTSGASYDGLTVSGGTFTHNDASNIDIIAGSGTVTINSGGTLNMTDGGAMNFIQDVTVNSGGTMNITNTSGSNTVIQNSTFTSSGDVNVNVNGRFDVQSSGNVNLTGGTFDLSTGGVFTFDNSTAVWSQSGGSVATIAGDGNDRAIIMEGTMTIDGSGTRFVNNYSTNSDYIGRDGVTLNLTDGGSFEHLNNITLDTNLTVNGSGSYTTSGKIVANANLTFENTGGTTMTNAPNIEMSGTGTIQTANTGSISGLGALIKTGAGTTTTIGNKFADGGLDADIIQVQSGTLLLGKSNAIADATDVSLEGGTLSTGGFDETAATLTLASGSVIDMGGGSTLTFSDFSYTGGALSIWNWAGTLDTAGGASQLIFNSTFSSNLDQIQFYSDSGSTAVGEGSKFIGNELVAAEAAIPEPSTYITGGCLVLFLGWHAYRRKKNATDESAEESEKAAA